MQAAGRGRPAGRPRRPQRALPAGPGEDRPAPAGRRRGRGRRPRRGPRTASGPVSSSSRRSAGPRPSRRRPTSSTGSGSSPPRPSGSRHSSRSTTSSWPAWSTRNVDVRSSALNEVGSHWSWLPGRSMTPVEEDDPRRLEGALLRAGQALPVRPRPQVEGRRRRLHRRPADRLDGRAGGRQRRLSRQRRRPLPGP